MPRRVCLAIGVGTITPLKNARMRFGHLDGAPIAAKHFGEWARQAGFGPDNVRVVTDEAIDSKPNPVTRLRVQTAVDELFPANAERVAHLLLVFCGHGLTDTNFRSISWLFSDSLEQKYRVKADAFHAELLLHGVERVTLISDACRESPKEADLQRLDAVRGIAAQGLPVESPKFDTLAACQDTKLSYMLMQPASAYAGKCVFSGVVLDALWGLDPSAFINDQITVSSLGACVQKRTPKRAKEYRLTALHPDCMVNPEDAVLYDSVAPLAGASDLQPWPAPSTASVMGVITEAAAIAGNIENSESAFERLHSDEVFRNEMLGPTFGASHFELGTNVEFGGLPESSRSLIGGLAQLGETRTLGRTFGMSVGRVKSAIITQVAEQAAEQVRKNAVSTVRRSIVQIKPLRMMNGANLMIAEHGAKIWSRAAVETKRRTRARSGFRVETGPLGQLLFVELRDDVFAPVFLYPGLYTTVKRSPIGDLFQAFGAEGIEPLSNASLSALADFGAGRIDATQVDALANKLRAGKHYDPILGVLCAYLYRTTADFDNIRRMAYYFVENNQPIPFDVVLLGKMKVDRIDGEGFRATVPAVKARELSSITADTPHYAKVATESVQGNVGGLCPWLGQGWDYVADPHSEWAALVEGLEGIAPEIRRRGFTLFPRKVGLKLAEQWGLKPQL